MSTATRRTSEVFTAVSMARLVRIELRKLTDTRSGFWLLLITAAASLLIIGGIVISVRVTGNEAGAATFADLVTIAAYVQRYLVPVLGILLITTEWTQRTALVTFSLVPRRGRVLVAKLLAGLIFALVLFLLDLLLGGIGYLVQGDSEAAVATSPWWGAAVLLGVAMVQGIAFGAALLNSPAAISLYFVLPIVVSIVGATVPNVDGIVEWIDLERWLGEVTSAETTSQTWTHLATSMLFWVGVPAAVGVARVLRTEVK